MLRKNLTLWFQLIVTPQGIEKVTIQLIDTPTKVYAIGARLFLSKVPLEVLQNWVLIQLIVTPHILGKVQGQIKEVCRLIEPCLLIGTREYYHIAKDNLPSCIQPPYLSCCSGVQVNLKSSPSDIKLRKHYNSWHPGSLPHFEHSCDKTT